MIDSLVLQNLVAFSAQTAIIAATALILPAVLRITSAGFRYTFVRAMLLLCLTVPWLQTPEVIRATTPLIRR